MEEDELFDRQLASLVGFIEVVAAASPSGRLLQANGVTASLVPEAPHRSVCNSVSYDRPASLAAHLERLAGEYERAGIAAWTVWVPEGDGTTAKLLESAGHSLDAAPRAMGLELDRLDTSAASALEAEMIEPSLVGSINDTAYEFAEQEFERALHSTPPGLLLYGARSEGTVAACVATLDREGDCGVYFVATLPQARGAGLATALMIHALERASERGCTTATLQATKAGYPVYERLGFRDLGAVQMWERRLEVS